MQFLDFKEYLQNKLNEIVDGVFDVTNERNIKSDADKVNVVIKQLAGSVYDNSASVPYEINVYTSDIDSVKNIFTALARANNNKYFDSIVNEGTEENPDYHSYTIYPFFNTPVVMSSEFEMAANHYARVVVFANLNILFGISNIKEIKIDNESIEFSNGNISYITELHSFRISGQELNTNRKRASGVNLTFKMVNKIGGFSQKVKNIMFGKLSGNTPFEVEITTTDNSKETIKMILTGNNYSFGRNTPVLPTLDITLTKYDERG